MTQSLDLYGIPVDKIYLEGTLEEELTVGVYAKIGLTPALLAQHYTEKQINEPILQGLAVWENGVLKSTTDI